MNTLNDDDDLDFEKDDEFYEIDYDAEEDDEEYLTFDEISEIWGVDFNDPDLDVDDIPGDR